MIVYDHVDKVLDKGQLISEWLFGGFNFLVKTFFSRLNFWTTLLSRIMPNFWWTDIPHRIFLKKNFLGGMMIFGQKTYFKFHNRTDTNLYYMSAVVHFYLKFGTRSLVNLYIAY